MVVEGAGGHSGCIFSGGGGGGGDGCENCGTTLRCTRTKEKIDNE